MPQACSIDPGWGLLYLWAGVIVYVDSAFDSKYAAPVAATGTHLGLLNANWRRHRDWLSKDVGQSTRCLGVFLMKAPLERRHLELR